MPVHKIIGIAVFICCVSNNRCHHATHKAQTLNRNNLATH